VNNRPTRAAEWRRRPGVLLATATILLFTIVVAVVDSATEPTPDKGTEAHVRAVTSAVEGDRIRANEAASRDWPTYGLDYAETRFSHLRRITDANVKDLGLVWTYDLESTRGVEATPLVVGGIMYVTASWSVVHAVDVRTGQRLWTYDPQVPRNIGFKGCCDVVNRGVALYRGKVFVGAFDGRLIALDAATGKPLWQQDTIVDHTRPYTITGAPRVFKGKVIIGNGGAEYGVRGYITAYDAESGAQKWRWFTVPGDPGEPFENEAMAKAAKTWDPSGKYWEIGGGGTVWDTMAFDPVLNLMDDKHWTADSPQPGQPHSGVGWNTAKLVNTQPPASQPFGRLIAWDPVAQREAWRQEQISPWNGGTLTSAGNLVFQGTADGRFIAYDAKSGEKLWEAPVGTGIVAAPITYEVDDVQYVSIAVGWGGVYGLSQRATERQGPGHVYTFALGGKAPLPDIARYKIGALVAGVKYDPAHVQEGMMLYVGNCIFCHGVPAVDRGGNIRNLGYVNAEVLSNLESFVFNGRFVSQGMPDFTGKLTPEDVAKIKAFIQGTADSIRPK
jgi:glucose dehydrogenase/mono/diheme cytochrome c family protein